MKPSRNLFLRSGFLAAMIAFGAVTAAQAANFWWDGTTGNWDTTANWSTSLAGTTNPSAAPLATISDTLTFNTTPGAASTSILYINGNRGNGGSTPVIATLNFSGSGETSLLGGNSTTAANNSLYVNTITVNAGSGAVNFGTTAATGKVDIRMGTAAVTNNSASLLTIASGLQTRGSTGTTTITITGTGNTLVSGAVGGGSGATVALSKTGTGILTLSGANTSGYSGGTTISEGTLTFLNTGAKSTTGSANHVFSAGATLGLGVATSGSFYTDTDITNAFSLNGVGTGNLSRISVTTTTNVGIDTSAGNFDRGAIATTAKGLAKLGANTLTLTGTNLYTGVTTVSGGTLKVSSTGVINNASTSGGTGVVIGGSTLDIDGGTVNFNGGTGLAVGDNTSAGNVIVRTGSKLNLTGNIAIGQGSSGVGNTPVSTFTQSGGTTTLGAASTIYLGNYRGATMDIQGGSLTSSSSAIIGVRGNSTLTISGASTAVSFTSIALGLSAGSMLPTADLNLNGGTLTLGASGITKDNLVTGVKTVSFDGGTLKASATSTDFVNADFVYVKAGGATINTDVNDVTIDNQLLQFGATTGALTKSGAGKLTLSATNTYTGTTTIDTGTLALGTGGSINNSSGVNLVNDGHFNVSAITSYSVASLTGNGSVTGDLTVTGALGIGASPGTVTFNDDLTLGGSSISTFEINDLTSLYDLAKGGTGSQTVTFGGTLILNFLSGFSTSGTVKIFDFENYAGSFNTVTVTPGLLASGYTATFNSATGSVTVVPEPSATLLGGLGLLCLLRRRR